MPDFTVPAGWPTHRHVEAPEAQRNWGCVEVYDTSGVQIQHVYSCCVCTGEVVAATRTPEGLILTDASGVVWSRTYHPAPLTIRKLK